MKKLGLITIFFILLVFISFVIQSHRQQKQVTQKPIKVNFAKNKPNPILTPDTNTAALGTSTSATFRTYNSPDGGYSITYPSIWTPSTQDQLKDFQGDVTVFSTGPVGKEILGYPSFLQVAVDENPKELSLQSFISQHYGSVHLTVVTIGGITGQETKDIQWTVPNTTIWIKPNTKIYQIRFFDGAQPKISKDQLTKILASFIVH